MSDEITDSSSFLREETRIGSIIGDLRNEDFSRISPSRNYRITYELDFNKKIGDSFFFDRGRQKDFQSYPSIKNELSDAFFEVILYDRKKDPVISDFLKYIDGEYSEKWENLLVELRRKDPTYSRDPLCELISEVSQFFGGEDVSVMIKTKEAIEAIQKETGHKNIILLGQLKGHGICRHRSLLFKIICDLLNIRCKLVRGYFVRNGIEEAHSWNVIQVCNEVFIVDCMNCSHPIAEGSFNHFQEIVTSKASKKRLYEQTIIEKRYVDFFITQFDPSGGRSGESIRQKILFSNDRTIIYQLLIRKDTEIFPKGSVIAVKVSRIDYIPPGKPNLQLIYAEKEASIIKSLSHENIVGYYCSYLHEDRKNEEGEGESDDDDDDENSLIQLHGEKKYFCLFMEKMMTDGKGFLGVCLRKKLKDKPQQQAIESLIFLLQAARGLRYLHDLGYLHLDFKLSNVLVTLRNKATQIQSVKLIDFAGSKEKNVGLFSDTVISTTPRYQAPELEEFIKNFREKNVEPYEEGKHVKFPFDESVDIYSFGKVMLDFVEFLRFCPAYEKLAIRCSDKNDFRRRPELDSVIDKLRNILEFLDSEETEKLMKTKEERVNEVNKKVSSQNYEISNQMKKIEEMESVQKELEVEKKKAKVLYSQMNDYNSRLFKEKKTLEEKHQKSMKNLEKYKKTLEERMKKTETDIEKLTTETKNEQREMESQYSSELEILRNQLKKMEEENVNLRKDVLKRDLKTVDDKRSKEPKKNELKDEETEGEDDEEENEEQQQSSSQSKEQKEPKNEEVEGVDMEEYFEKLLTEKKSLMEEKKKELIDTEEDMRRIGTELEEERKRKEERERVRKEVEKKAKEREEMKKRMEEKLELQRIQKEEEMKKLKELEKSDGKFVLPKYRRLERSYTLELDSDDETQEKDDDDRKSLNHFFSDFGGEERSRNRGEDVVSARINIISLEVYEGYPFIDLPKNIEAEESFYSSIHLVKSDRMYKLVVCTQGSGEEISIPFDQVKDCLKKTDRNKGKVVIMMVLKTKICDICVQFKFVEHFEYFVKTVRAAMKLLGNEEKPIKERESEGEESEGEESEEEEEPKQKLVEYVVPGEEGIGGKFKRFLLGGIFGAQEEKEKSGPLFYEISPMKWTPYHVQQFLQHVYIQIKRGEIETLYEFLKRSKSSDLPIQAKQPTVEGEKSLWHVLKSHLIRTSGSENVFDIESRIISCEENGGKTEKKGLTPNTVLDKLFVLKEFRMTWKKEMKMMRQYGGRETPMFNMSYALVLKKMIKSGHIDFLKAIERDLKARDHIYSTSGKRQFWDVVYMENVIMSWLYFQRCWRQIQNSYQDRFIRYEEECLRRKTLHEDGEESLHYDPPRCWEIDPVFWESILKRFKERELIDIENISFIVYMKVKQNNLRMVRKKELIVIQHKKDERDAHWEGERKINKVIILIDQHEDRIGKLMEKMFEYMETKPEFVPRIEKLINRLEEKVKNLKLKRSNLEEKMRKLEFEYRNSRRKVEKMWERKIHECVPEMNMMLKRGFMESVERRRDVRRFFDRYVGCLFKDGIRELSVNLVVCLQKNAPGYFIHHTVLISNLKVNFFNNSFCFLSDVSQGFDDYEELICLDAKCPLLFHNYYSLYNLIARIAFNVVRSNVNFKFKPKGGKKGSLEKNSVQFADDFLKTFDCTPFFAIVKEYLELVDMPVSNECKKGEVKCSNDLRFLKIGKSFGSRFRKILEGKFKVRKEKNGNFIYFTCHADLDDFYDRCLKVDEDFELNYPGICQLLKGFDKAYWLRLVLNPDDDGVKPGKVCILKRKSKF